jgi:hypothetical protein
LRVIPEVVSGTLPFTFSTLVVFGAVPESVEVVDVLLLLLQARIRLARMNKETSFFISMVFVLTAIILPMPTS